MNLSLSRSFPFFDCGHRRPQRTFSLPALLLSCGLAVACSGQTAFFDFNTQGQYTNSFNPWNDAGGVNGRNYSFMESPGVGVGASRGISVFQSTDTTATYNGGSWNFSTNGAAIIVSTLIKANALSSGNKVQLGLLNVDTNGLNNNAGIAFESFRFIPSGAGVWPLWEQYRTAGAAGNTQLGTVNVVPGEWYKFVVSLTNTAGGSGGYNAGCALYGYGAPGLTPRTNMVTFSTALSHAGQTDITVPALYAALRAFQNGGIDAWDDFLVYTPASLPVITLGLTNTSAAVGQAATFAALADGPGAIGFSWYTNGILVGGASNPSYTTPLLNNSYTNIIVVARNANGSVSNAALISVLVPSVAIVTNLPAGPIGTASATLNGQVLDTGGASPMITIYYGPADGGTTAAAWSNNVALGLQSGSFSQAVSALSPGTTYYFTAEAVNAGGVAWAVPSQSFMTLVTNPPGPAAVAVLTHHNDNARTGRNLNETVLNTSNVNSNQFGLLFTRAVDDQIYAQPLIMTNVAIAGKGIHNLVIVATVNDSVYAFDADDSSVTAPYWKTSFINPPNVVAPANTDMSAIGACAGNYQDFSGNIGIVGTPVVDPVATTLYLVARTKENGTTFVQRLHALDITTGLDRSNSPIVITATFPGNGAGSSGGMIPFDPIRQNQRPGLLLVNGLVYISWSSHCDNGPYHGWVIGYDQNTLQQVAVYNDTPNGSNGGIWMSGQPPAADTNGNLYLSTGNGTVDTSGTINRGESLLKLTRSGNSLTVASWFTPYNWQTLENGDLDLGSGGLLLVPGTTLAFSGGKEGIVYLVNRDNMGGLTTSTTTNDNVVQSFTVTTDQLHCGPVWWDGPTNSCVYIWPSSVNLQQYVFNRGLGQFTLPAFAQSPTAAPTGQPGGLLTVSANGATSGSGIIWAAHQLTGDANQSVRPGILHAYDAQNVSRELWNSQQNSARDAVGNFAKFVPPTVANGKVYLATFSSRLNIYGLLVTNAPASLLVSPGSLSYGLVVAGQSSNKTFQVVNNGGQTLNGAATTTAPFSITGGSPFSLSAGQTGLVQVAFSPTGGGTFSNVVIFASNGGSSTNALLAVAAVVPAASFAGGPTSGAAPLLVSFTDSSTGTITNRLWSFGDGATTNTVLTNLTHNYGLAGTNTVMLTVTGPVGTNTLSQPDFIIVTNLGPVTVIIAISGNQVQLTWPSGTLQTAVQVAGPYTNIVGATSPYLVAPSEATRFFRVQVR